MPNSLHPERKRVTCPWDPAQYVEDFIQCSHCLRTLQTGGMLLQYSLRVRVGKARLQMSLSPFSDETSGDGVSLTMFSELCMMHMT